MPTTTDGASAPATDGVASGHRIEFELHSPDFHAPAHVVQWTRDKIEARLHKYGRHVQAVVVHLRDLNGPKGGVGFSAHLEARLGQMEPVNVIEQGEDLHAAIDLALDRLGVVIGRHVEKARKSPREHGAQVARDSKLSEG
jgi:ribosome-associated translation inhibitor RaiA